MDLEKLSRYPVSLIKVNNHLDLTSILGKNNETKIFSVLDNIQYNKKKNKRENIIFTTLNTIKQYLVQSIRENTKNVDFCSIILINNIHSHTLEKLVIINLWKEVYKISDRRPYLFITTLSEFTPSFPFHLREEQCQIIDSEEEIYIEYHTSNFSPNNSNSICDSLEEIIIQKNGENEERGENSIWVVFYSGKKDLAKQLYKKIGKNTNIYTENSFRKLETKKFNSKKRSIIIIKSNFISSSFTNKISGVFDSMTCILDENINYTTKQISDARAYYQTSGFVYRLCTEEYYNELPKITLRLYEKKCLDVHYLETISEGLDIDQIFSNIISEEKKKEDLEILRIRGAVQENKLTVIGRMILSLPLKTDNCCFLYDWIVTKKPVFPGIVAAVISELKEPMEKIEDRNIFCNYLKIINQNLMLNSTLEEVKEIPSEIIEKIKCNIQILRKEFGFKFSIGVYDSDNLINNLNEYFEKAYFKETYHLIDKENLLYKNNDKVFTLNKDKFGYVFKNPPEKLISFYKNRSNRSDTSIQKGTNYIYYFYPFF